MRVYHERRKTDIESLGSKVTARSTKRNHSALPLHSEGETKVLTGRLKRGNSFEMPLIPCSTLYATVFIVMLH